MAFKGAQDSTEKETNMDSNVMEQHAPAVDHIVQKTGEVPAAPLPPVLTRSPLGIYNPEDDEPPTRGMPKIQYDMHKRKQAKDPSYKIPRIQPIPAEAAERQQRRITRKEEELNVLTDKKPRIIMVANTKGGGGKTPLIMESAMVEQEVARTGVLMIDANQDGGNMHSALGVTRNDTILLREAVAKRKWLNTQRAISKVAYKTRPGVYFIGSDEKKDVLEGVSIVDNTFIPVQTWQKLTLTSFTEGVQAFGDSFHSVYLDTGNGTGGVTSIGSAMMADVMLFPALVEKPSSFENLVTTMISYIDYGFGAKVQNGFVIINGTQPGDTKEKYLNLIQSYLDQYPIKDYVDPETHVKSDVPRRLSDLGIQEDRVFLIPFSQHIKDEKIISVDPKVIGFDTYEAYLDLLITIYKQNAHYEQLVVSNPHAQHMATVSPATD